MNTSASINRTELSDHYFISPVIKGGWQVSTGHTIGRPVDTEKAINDTLTFIRAGITTFDFGDIYTGVEEMIGKALKRLQDEVGSTARDLVQLHTKYVPDRNVLPVHSHADVERIVHRSQERLGVDVLDLVQFHWWDYGVEGYIEAMQSLAQLQREGCIRLLGVTNFDVARMQEFVDAGVTPSTLQLQYSLLDRRPENGMVEFCREHDIKLLCYGTVAGGYLSERYLNVPEPTDAFENRSLVKYKLIIDEFGGWDAFQGLLRRLHTIAQKHQCDISTVASAYILTRPQVTAVIVGARDTRHIEANKRIAEVQLDDEDFAMIRFVLEHAKGPLGDVYDLERNDSKHSGIMHTNNNAK